MGANSGREQETRAGRHADEKLHLMVEHAAVVEQADGGQQRGAGENARDLLLRRAAQRENDSEHESEIDGDAAEQGNRLHVDFARAGAVDHAVAQSNAANGNGETRATPAARRRKRSDRSRAS